MALIDTVNQLSELFQNLTSYTEGKIDDQQLLEKLKPLYPNGWLLPQTNKLNKLNVYILLGELGLISFQYCDGRISREEYINEIKSLVTAMQ